MRNQPDHGDEGFALIELLVVILIIGILAAIALPAFTGQSDKAKDASAKANARDLVSHVEACYAVTASYPDCETGKPALDLGGIPGAVAHGTSQGYEVSALSKSGNTFVITKDDAGLERSCTVATGADRAGCHGGTW